MIPDPTRYLADVGNRLLQTARPFFVVPVPLRLPGAYSDALLDPVAALSGVCDGLLEPHAPPDAAEDLAPASTGSLPPPRQRRGVVAGSASSSPHGVSQTETSRAFPNSSLSQAPSSVNWRDVGIASNSSPASPESYARSAGAPEPRSDASVLQQEDIGPPDTESPEHLRPPRSGQDPQHALRARPITRREVPAPGARRSAESSSADGGRPVHPGEPLPEGSGAPFPERQVPREDHRFETIAAPPAGADFSRVDSDPDGPSTSRRGDIRLASDSERLVAVLRAHVADPVPLDDAEDSLAPAKNGGEHRDPANDRISVEEVVERLADELETEFVRTYGSSGV